ncbi:SCP2 sterol-binding domain-containing protein [Candidatus Vesicomyidisocius calyptogenae]|uniref:SCP2 sterol-binding domain-containing protein n=1 Tax=Vesicomyosocius okutanii subsp. Calyptogena okutanii (strain HA) TaxID=412965 RepID=UPI003D80C0D6
MLNKKTIGFSLKNLQLNLHFIYTNNQIFVLPATNKPTNVNITLKSIVFIFLLQCKGLTQLIRQDKINIHSDFKTTQLLINLLKKVDIDFKEIISKYTSDIVPYQLAKLTKKIQKVNIQKINSLEMIKNRLSTLSINKIKTKRHKRKNSWTLCIAF